MSKLSVVCITYNQAKYIAQALDSILAQKTNFEFEIIVSDDCSTDGTIDILKNYAQKHNNINLILRKKNIGAIANYIETLALAKGEYVIVNEGDDYFIDENKLQKQVDFLDKNLDYSICFHPVKRVFEQDNNKYDFFPTEDMKRRITDYNFANLLNENFMQTNSVMYRWNMIDDVYSSFPKNILPGDWYLHLLFAQKGKIKCLDDIMSVYRINTNGIWFNSYKNRNSHLAKNAFKIMNFYRQIYLNIAGKSEQYKLKLLDCFSVLTSALIKERKYFLTILFVLSNINLFIVTVIKKIKLTLIAST